MNKEQLKKEVVKYSWRPWLERIWGAFLVSTFEGGISNESMKATGVDVELVAILHQNNRWYWSDEVFLKFEKDIEEWMKKTGKNIFFVSESCEKFYEIRKEEIKRLASKDEFSVSSLEYLRETFRLVSTYIWLAHGFEEVYTRLIKGAARKYVEESELDQFVGDISFPIKKNKHSILEEKLLAGENIEKLAEEFGWIKNRDGFSELFSVEDLKEFKAKIEEGNNIHQKHEVKIPDEIRPLVSEIQELVYYRTLRSDVFFEFLSLARPILKKAASHFDIEFKELRNYSLDSLVSGSPKKYGQKIFFAEVGSDYSFFDEPIILNESNLSQEVKGNIAFKGIAQGIARIVKSPADLDKVKEGDVLVTQMTFPAFIMAMKRASAFVTDEGGITCHAAIVAREMKKPCIIGTKIATKVLKDGDFVEVDAERGIVTIIKKVN